MSYCLSDYILTKLSAASVDIINIKLARALHIMVVIKLPYKCVASIIATDAILLIVRWGFPPLHALLYTLYNRSYVDKLQHHVVSR